MPSSTLAMPAPGWFSISGYAYSGYSFIVMEFLQVHQRSASSLTTSRRLSPIEAVRTLLPHRRRSARCARAGIVHRDLKPENVIVASPGKTVQPRSSTSASRSGAAPRIPPSPSSRTLARWWGAPPISLPSRQRVARTSGAPRTSGRSASCSTSVLRERFPFSTDNYRDLFLPDPRSPGGTLAHAWRDRRSALADRASRPREGFRANVGPTCRRSDALLPAGSKPAESRTTSPACDSTLAGFRASRSERANARGTERAAFFRPTDLNGLRGEDERLRAHGSRSTSLWLAIGCTGSARDGAVARLRIDDTGAERGRDTATAVELPVVVSSFPPAPVLAKVVDAGSAGCRRSASPPDSAPLPPVAHNAPCVASCDEPPAKRISRKPLGSGTAAARAESFRQPADSDLLEPY